MDPQRHHHGIFRDGCTTALGLRSPGSRYACSSVSGGSVTHLEVTSARPLRRTATPIGCKSLPTARGRQHSGDQAPRSLTTEQTSDRGPTNRHRLRRRCSSRRGVHPVARARRSRGDRRHVDDPTAGRFSQYSPKFVGARRVRRTDEFVEWLGDEFGRGTIDLVAPTSDYVSFCVAEALDGLGRKPRTRGFPTPRPSASRCSRTPSERRWSALAFPRPAWAAPTSLDEAQEAARQIGYPGGSQAAHPRRRRDDPRFGGPFGRRARPRVRALSPCRWQRTPCWPTTPMSPCRSSSVTTTSERSTWSASPVVSMSDGAVLALGHCRKMSQSPRRLGIGTMFEPIPEPPFAAAAVEAVRTVLGSGLFELEVLVDRTLASTGPST